MVQNDIVHRRSVLLLSKITGVLVSLLAVGAFALSFTALSDLASANGVSPGLMWIWPLVLDGAIVVFSMAVLRASIYGESVRYPMTLVVCATGASLIFNLAHAPDGVVAKLMASVPPLALFAAFELVMRQIRSEVERNSCLMSLNEMSEQLELLSNRRDILEGQVQQMVVRRDSLRLEIKQAKSPSVHALLDIANTAKAEKISKRLALAADLSGQGKAPAEIAALVGVSTKTIKRDLAKLDPGLSTLT